VKKRHNWKLYKQK